MYPYNYKTIKQKFSVVYKIPYDYKGSNCNDFPKSQAIVGRLGIIQTVKYTNSNKVWKFWISNMYPLSFNTVMKSGRVGKRQLIKDLNKEIFSDACIPKLL